MKTKLLFFFGIFLLLSSCTKVIDIKETDLIAGDIALKTLNNNEQSIIGAYAGLGIEMAILLNGVMADELRVADFYNAATAHEWQYTSTDIVLRDAFTAFPAYYRIVDRVNRVLQVLPNISTANVTEEALKSKLKGEALFLRAFCHFELYRYYCNSSVGTDLGMAYIKEPSLEPQARLTIAPFITALKADLAEAKPLLPAFSSSTDIKRTSRIVVSALQARLALYMKEWNDAITYSTEFIIALPVASRSAFANIWTDASTSEIAFKLSRTPSIGAKIGSLYRGTSASASNIGTVTWRPSDKLWNSFDQANDIRFTAYLKNEPLLATRSSTKLIKKYEGTAYGTPGENVADAKVFRTGEMYLIRAEAKAETNDLINAAADLNALRSARISGYVPVILLSKDAAINAIMDERFKELAFEGHRFWDLKRRNLPVTRLASDAPTSTGTTLPAGNFRFLLPIPNTEIQANPKIQQNQGYTN